MISIRILSAGLGALDLQVDSRDDENRDDENLVDEIKNAI